MPIADYELLGAIGQGQFGVAYKARHRLDGQLYCIKRVGLANSDQTDALKEVQLLAQLDHPNIIGYKESFIDPKDGALCIATTFCEEGDLFNRIRKRQQANQFFAENEVMDMFVQIASALMHIHSKRILHRDLKTQNIFIAKGSIIKLGDFGISKVLEKTDQFATTVTGTPYYMAPEICTNQPYTFKSDIWSLGCVLYELCTLKHAFAADSLLSLVYQIVRGNVPPLPADQFSQGLSSLVTALLVRDAAQRPTLADIFQMPFVLQHLQRYNHESKRSLIKHSNTMAKRRAALDGSLSNSPRGSQAGDDTGLTPKQKLERKKQQEAQRREMELQAATVDLNKDRGMAAQRKQAQMTGSNAVGLPGGANTAPRAGANDTLPGGLLQTGGQDQLGAISAGGRLQQPPAGGGAARGGRGGGGLEDSMVNMGTVNMGTMPSGGYGGTLAGGARGGGGGWGEKTAYQLYEERPIRAGAAGRGGGYGQEEDESVMMGTVNMGTQRPQGGLGTTRSPLSAPPPPPSNLVNGFKFGVTQAPGAMPVFPPVAQRSDSPARAASPAPTNKIKFGISSDTQPRGSFAMDLRGSGASPQEPSYLGGGDDDDGRTTPTRSGARGGGGDSEYESDFDEFADQDQETINQRCKILDQMQTLERTRGKGGDWDDGIAQVRERVGTAVKSSKASMLRERCQQELGFHFPEVYAFLRRARSQPQAPDEAQVQKQLQDLVNGDKNLLQGCFLVDQLVFQEMMYE